MLSKDNVKEYDNIDDCIATYLDFSKIDKEHIVSDVVWKGSVESDTILENIGYTGVDNGFISYQRDLIGNDEFLDLFTNSKFDLSKFNNRFFVTKVNGNANLSSYPIENHDDYTSLKGGFYQGFFKIDGDKYQTLPHRIKDEWNFNITLRKKEYETPSNILNKRYAENEGIFFYIGTRAENKFWEMYKSQSKMQDFKYDDSDDYSSDYSMMDSDVTKHQYHEDIPDFKKDDGYGEFCDCFEYFEDGIDPYNDTDNNQIKNDYFIDGYTGKGTTDVCDCPINGLAIEDDYIQEQLNLDDVKLTDTKGFAIGEKGFYEIKTDNKFIIFNNTKDGFNKNTWKNEYEYTQGSKSSRNKD